MARRTLADAKVRTRAVEYHSEWRVDDEFVNPSDGKGIEINCLQWMLLKYKARQDFCCNPNLLTFEKGFCLACSLMECMATNSMAVKVRERMSLESSEAVEFEKSLAAGANL